ncbi:MAG TPA: hemagglutinin repeat-containing protein, partial [Hydrogenophaga sp.]|uniref:hemagglutinin repeat-containing protein n=1 Tax=Hydrogenophaga sp. TaxID=1904254 RepID=UPI002CCE66F0
RQWLASDYQLAALNIDPASVHKRLGDGFLEQRLMREQIAQLTGQRFLGDHTDDDAQYLALLQAGATFAQAHQLRPGITLTAEQVAALTSDIVWLEAQEVTLPDGRTVTALVPRVYLMPREGELAPDGALIAGREVHLNLSGEFLNSGSVAGRDLVLIDANGIHSSGRIGSQGVTALRAQQDIEVDGGDVSAKDLLVLDAGRDIKVTSTSAQSTDGQAVVLERVARLYVSEDAGVLLARAGQDIELQAALAQAGQAGQAGVVDMHAGRDLRLSTLNTREALDTTRDEKNYGRVQRSAEVGSAIGGNEVSLSGGRDVQMRAAQVQANGDRNNAGLNGNDGPNSESPYYEQDNNGRLNIHAGRHLDITAGEANYQVEHGVYAKSSGVLGSSSTETRRLDSHTRAQGSSLGGRNVALSADGDITFKGSHAIADEHLDVSAGGDVRVLSARTEHRQERFREEKTSGLYGSGAGLTLGRQQHSSEQQVSGTGAAGSTLGALRGDVNIRAGQTYEQVGSDVLAPEGDIDVRAKNIRVTEARTSEQRWQEEKMRQSGFTVGLSGAPVQAMQGAVETLDAIGHTDNKRMKALGAATAGLQVRQGINTAAQAQRQGDASGGMAINFSIGSSSSRSTSEANSDSAQGSRVLAGGDIVFIAEGADKGAGERSDILIRGSDLTAGREARLKAEGKVELRAAENTTKERTESENHAASFGVGMQLGGSGAGVGFTASASSGKGNAEGESLSHTNTHVRAGERVSIESGEDTILAGAVVSAERVEADIGGDLLIESLQDSASYREKSKQSSASATFGAGAGGSFSASKTDIQSEYASVGEQSAIRAGDGGFGIKVEGKTVLKGGAITSTQVAVDERRNGFESDGGVELEDVHNEARYKASSSSATVGAGGQLSSSGAGIGSDDGRASSITKAGISDIAGDKDARTGDAETGLAPIFDKDKVKDEVNAQVAITKGFGQQAVPAWRDYANRLFEEAVKAGDEDAAQCWAPDGACRAVGHALIGGLTGGIEGASAAAFSSASAPHVQAFLQSLGVPADAARAITQLSALGAGAAIGGSEGASAGFNEASHNAVIAIPLLVESVVAGGAVAARACLSSPACLQALRLGGVALVAKVAALVDPADGARIPGYENIDPDPHGGNTVSPVWGSVDNKGATTPGATADPMDVPPSGVGVPVTGIGTTVSPIDTGGVGSSTVMNINGQDQSVELPSLIDADGAQHILVGDRPGSGGHLWPGQPGKTPFPQSWDADKVLGSISDVATDPASITIPARGGRTIVRGSRDGVDIEVVVEPSSRGGRIVTGYPTNLSRNPR